MNYDPSEDWEDDKEPNFNVLSYQAFFKVSPHAPFALIHSFALPCSKCRPSPFKALFKVPDLWCDGVEAPDYVKLLNELLEDTQKRTALWNRLLKRFGLMDDKKIIGFGVSAAKIAAGSSKEGGSSSGIASPQPLSKHPYGRPPGSAKPDWVWTNPEPPPPRAALPMERAPAAASPPRETTPSTASKPDWTWTNPEPKPRVASMEVVPAAAPPPTASLSGGRFNFSSSPTPPSQPSAVLEPSKPVPAPKPAQPPTAAGSLKPTPPVKPTPPLPSPPSTLPEVPKKRSPVSLSTVPKSSSRSPSDHLSPGSMTQQQKAKQIQPLPSPTSPRATETSSNQQGFDKLPSALPTPTPIPFYAEPEAEYFNTPDPTLNPKEAMTPQAEPEPISYLAEEASHLQEEEEEREPANESESVPVIIPAEPTPSPFPFEIEGPALLSPWPYSDHEEDLSASDHPPLETGSNSTARAPMSISVSAAPRNLSPGPRAATAADRSVRVSNSGEVKDGRWYAAAPISSSPNRASTAAHEKRISTVRKAAPPAPPPLSLEMDHEVNQANNQLQRHLFVRVPKWASKPAEASPPPLPQLHMDDALSPVNHPHGVKVLWENNLALGVPLEEKQRGGGRSSWSGHGSSNTSSLSYIWAPSKGSHNPNTRLQNWQGLMSMSITPSGATTSHAHPYHYQNSDSPHHPQSYYRGFSPQASPSGGQEAQAMGGGLFRGGRSRWASSSGAFDQARPRVSHGGGAGGQGLRPSLNGGAERESPRMAPSNGERASWNPQRNTELNGLDLFSQAFPSPLRSLPKPSGSPQQQKHQQQQNSGLTHFQKRFSSDGHHGSK